MFGIAEPQDQKHECLLQQMYQSTEILIVQITLIWVNNFLFGLVINTSDDRINKNKIYLHNSASGDVFEHHTVAGFACSLSSGSRSSHKLLFKLIFIQDRQVYQVLFTCCQNTWQSGRVWPEKQRDTGRNSPCYDPTGHVVHTADEGEKPQHFFK